MVMDVQPSPQSVGREFVRQYYTLLNKAPDHLHRFYNTNSSFVHGGLDVHNREAVMVIGQKQIFAKIKQLKFRDCHAKISQVDAQSTLGNGVVVQVSGELSNDGQPMRRFTQTFVLAMQTPKKYYVHNDIFRYQDLYSEEEAELENGSAGQSLNGEPEPAATPLLQQQQVDGQLLQQPPQLENVQLDGGHLAQQGQLYYPVAEAPGSFVQLNGGGVAKQQQQQEVSALQQHQQQQQQHLAQQQAVHQQLHQQHQQQQQQHHHHQQQQQHQQQHQQQQQQHQKQSDLDNAVTAAVLQASEAVNNAADNSTTDTSYDRTTLSSSEQETEEQQQQHLVAEAEAAASAQAAAAAAQQQRELEQDPTPVAAAAAPVAAAPTPAPAPKTIQPSEPKTYANLFKSDVSFASAMSTAPALGSQQSRYGAAQRSEQRPSTEQSNAGARAAAAPVVSRPVRSQERRPSGEPAQRQQSFQSSTGQQTHYPNNQQLFLGSVPPQATDDELRQLFGKYGTVIDLRINSKTSGQQGKLPGGRTPPNFGFITYDDPEAVQNCLAHMPLYYPENSPDGQKLNVEEKKPRTNGPSSGPRGNDDRGMGRNIGGGGGGPRLGGGGAPGMMRGPSTGGSGGGGGSAGPRSGGAPGSGGGGPRGGAFNRNDQRSGPASGGGGGPQRGAGQTTGGGASGGVGGGSNSTYGRR